MKRQEINAKNAETKGYLFLIPVISLIIAFFVYPFIEVIRLSFYSTPFGFGPMEFSGFKNFITLFGEEMFRAALKNSFIWTGLSLVLQLTIPVGIALLLNKKFHGNSIARSLILLPWVTPAISIAIIARWILEPNIGVLNNVLLRMGILDRPINFFGKQTALVSLVLINTWKFIPFGTLLILAALQTIPSELYDASRVDGANIWQAFYYMIFPLIVPMISFVGFLAFVWNFNVFETIWLITKGGPGNATMTLPVLIYRKAFGEFRMDEACAVATIVGVILIGFGFCYFKCFLGYRGRGK